jgi:hypothetical protein
MSETANTAGTLRNRRILSLHSLLSPSDVAQRRRPGVNDPTYCLRHSNRYARWICLGEWLCWVGFRDARRNLRQYGHADDLIAEKGADTSASDRPTSARTDPAALGSSITKADAVFSPSEVLVYESELTSVEGVEDMRDQEGLRPIKRYECS